MDRTTKILIGIGVGALLLLGGGVTIVAIDKARARKLLGDAFASVGLPREWGIALGIVESDLTSTATNLTGPDGARGGAWGLTQITEKTARGIGYTGPMSRLLEDPTLAATLSAKLASQGKPKTIDDLGAWWNAGRFTAAALPEEHVTKRIYIPKLRAALTRAQG